MGSRRKHVLKIPLTDGEWAQVHTTFPRRSVPTAVRKLALGQSPPQRAQAQADRRELLAALAKLGNDLGQTKRHRRRELGKRRSHTLKIRFSADEWADVSATFPRRAVGTGIRGLALGEAAAHHSPARQDLVCALARIGNNLNQIARGINRANLTGEKIEAIRVLAKLAAIQDAMHQLL